MITIKDLDEKMRLKNGAIIVHRGILCGFSNDPYEVGQ